jgi:protocatechuate 3,4-dioxygenase beta subunit
MTATTGRMRRAGLGAAVMVMAGLLLAAMAPPMPAAAAGPVKAPARARFAGRLMARIAAGAALGGRSGTPGRYLHGGADSPAPGTGMIAGAVRGIAGAAFGGACVRASGPAGIRTVMTHADGRYVIGGLKPGGYRLRIDNCTGDSPLSYAWPGSRPVVTVLAGQVRTLAPARAWQSDGPGLAGGRARAQAATPKAGSISGRVTGHGRPLRGICAFAVRSSWTFAAAARATTSQAGRYKITGLRPGRYLVLFRAGERSCASHANWLPQWYPHVTSPYATSKAVRVRVRAAKDTARINGRLKLGAEIAGTVRTKTGRRVRGICVSTYTPLIVNGIYNYSASAASDRAGHYGLHGLFPGKYQVEFTIGCGVRRNYAQQWWRHKASPDHPNTIKVARRQIVTGIDAALTPGSAITGTVRARAAGARRLARVCVYAEGYRGNYADAVTTKNGTYRLAGIGPGRYQVSFDPSCLGTRSALYLPADRTISVQAGHTRSGLDVRLRPAAGISGIVRDPAGRPVDSVCIDVGDENNDFAFTNAHGRYSVTGVVPGRYNVEFETGCGNPGSLASQWYHNRPDRDSADLVTFTAGKMHRNVDATLHPGGTLAGVLTSKSGRPVKGDCLGVAAQHDWLDGTFTDGDVTTRNGRYWLPNLTPGEYRVSFLCAGGRYGDQWFNSRPDSTNADYLAINPGVTRLSEKLSRGAAITGTVTSKSGHPLRGLCVSVANARNGLFLSLAERQVTTGGHGRYRIGYLTPGHYLVEFSACYGGIYGSQWYHGKYSESGATPVTARPGGTTTGINAVLPVGGTISGTVTGPSGRPASGTCVEAFDAASESYAYTETSKTGHYKLEGLSNGRYTLSFTACYDQAPNLGSVNLRRQVRVVAPRHVSGVNIRLGAGGSIAGSVTGHPGRLRPAIGACVIAVPTNPHDSFQLTWADAAGHYRMSGLAPGAYQVYLGDPLCEFDLGIPGVAPQWFDNQPSQVTATKVAVSAGRTTRRISVALRSPGAIKGTVTTGAHSGVAGECVTAVPFRAGVDPATGLPPAADVAITSASGRFRLLDLAPGQYKVRFSSGCGDTGFASQWWDGAGSASSAKVITVGHVAVSGIDAILRR